ncbi:hypothetical protein FN846DRAFT_886128 [Sphaerosporella brunnea]|uniref:Uncharacterized protein n=1 Tax=Sphaerosporella brunnea TaxID=1250544 RepID=A0A5J5FAZ1_9PEZI|nr:hypothetical protein FN846DRAFT_886128 [Sphaerosporella brunnea]
MSSFITASALARDQRHTTPQLGKGTSVGDGPSGDPSGAQTPSAAQTPSVARTPYAEQTPSIDPSVTRSSSALPEWSPEPRLKPQFYIYATAEEATRYARRYVDLTNWPSGGWPSTPVAFMGGGALAAFGDFTAKELDEMRKNPEAFRQQSEGIELELESISESMEEEDAQGRNPAGRAELAARDEEELNAELELELELEAEAELELELEAEAEVEAELQPSATQSRRGQSWMPWEDRFLVYEILNVDPYTCARGNTEEKWAERAAKLVKEHQAGNARSLQKTGTNEEVTDFIVNLDLLEELAATSSKDAEKKNEVRSQQQKLDDDGKRVRKAAYIGLEGDERRTKRPKADAAEVLNTMSKHLVGFDQEKQQLEEVEERRHQESTGTMRGMLEELKAGQEDANRRDWEQRIRDREQNLRDREQKARDRMILGELRSLRTTRV